MTIRFRLLLVTALALAAGLGVLVTAGNLFFRHTVRGDTAQLLRTRAEAQIASLSVTRTGVRVRGTPNDEALDLRAWIISGTRVVERPADIPRSLNRTAVALGRRLREADITAPTSVRLLAKPISAPGSRRVVGAVVVGVSTSAFDQLQRKVLGGSILIAALVLISAIVVVRRALLAALGPVKRMTADAEDWSAHDLDRRFNLGRPRDEITGLATTLDHLLGRIAASRRHEQQFAADVAHELRTPLAAIRGHAELGTAEAGDPELAAIAVQAERMATTIDTLLAHARREFDPRDGGVDLLALLAEFDGVELRVEPSVLLAEGDWGLVRRAIAPLIDNARRHTRSESVHVELASVQDRVRVVVRDDGPGVDPAIGERAFDPGVRGPAEPDGGAGLGLPLARRLARSCGGEVRIGPGPGGCFILDLPAHQE